MCSNSYHTQPVIYNNLVNVDINNKPFSVVETQNAVKKLKNHKSPGICGISLELLKIGSRTILLWLQILFDETQDAEIL